MDESIRVYLPHITQDYYSAVDEITSVTDMEILLKQEVHLDSTMQAILAESLSLDPKVHPLMPEDIPHHYGKRKKKGIYGEKKKKRPLWLTSTCWEILQLRHAAYQFRVKAYYCSVIHPESTECPDHCSAQHQAESITLSTLGNPPALLGDSHSLTVPGV